MTRRGSELLAGRLPSGARSWPNRPMTGPMAGLLALSVHLILVLFWAFALPASAATNPVKLPVRELSLANQTLQVEIAHTPATMSQGLMHRDHLPEDHGMLFLWPRDQVVGMWMKNTRIPLSVAFIDRDYRILNIADMQPHSLRTHPSTGPARYALEVNQGWFARHGIEAGTRIDDLERLLIGLRAPAD